MAKQKIGTQVHFVSNNQDNPERVGFIVAAEDAVEGTSEDAAVIVALDVDDRDAKLVVHMKCRYGQEYHLPEECPAGL